MIGSAFSGIGLGIICIFLIKGCDGAFIRSWRDSVDEKKRQCREQELKAFASLSKEQQQKVLLSRIATDSNVMGSGCEKWLSYTPPSRNLSNWWVGGDWDNNDELESLKPNTYAD